MYPLSRRHVTFGSAVVTTLLIIAAAVAGAHVAPAGADPADPPFTVSVTPTRDLIDGQKVRINLRARADVAVFKVQTRECRLGPAYATQEEFLFQGESPNCTESIPLSSSSDTSAARIAVYDIARSPDGLNLDYRVGIGSVSLQASPPITLTCGPVDPCALVTEVTVGADRSYVATPITFLDDDVIRACGGTAPGALATSTSDRLSDAWAGWTRAACRKPGATGAPTKAVFGGEGDALSAFSAGFLDLAYTGVGYNDATGLAPGPADTRRPAVTAPIALNAAVLAVSGGYTDNLGVLHPYPEVKLTTDEVAALFTGGFSYLSGYHPDLLSSIHQRNPLFSPNITPYNAENPAQGLPQMPAEGETSTWLMTRHLAQMSPSQWRAAPTGPPRTAYAVPALASPAFPAQQIGFFTGRPSLQKVLGISPASGAVFVMTDYATASAFGLTMVSIQNGNGAFVPPTPASLTATIPTMTKDANGVLVPNPNAYVPLDQPQPYPLTFVEYAMAPAEPLLADDCTARPASQALLTNWLNYLTTDGQSNLPAGLVPLTPDLAAEARADVAKVGASPVTGTCAPQATTTTTTPTTPAVPPPAADGSFDSSSFGGVDDFGSSAIDGPSDVGGSGADGSSSDTGSVSGGGSGGGLGTDTASSEGAAPSAGSPTTTNPAGAGNAAEISIPDFAGSRSPSGLAAVLSLIALAVLMTGAALVTSGRRRGPGGSPTPTGPTGLPAAGDGPEMIELR